jgi:hypothetical protein
MVLVAPRHTPPAASPNQARPMVKARELDRESDRARSLIRFDQARSEFLPEALHLAFIAIMPI